MELLVLVEGRGFKANAAGRSRMVGFFASRVVGAPGAEAIDTAALFQGILSELAANHVSQTPKAQLQISRVTPLRRRTGAYTGFTFFDQEWAIARFLRRLVGSTLS